jgi:O-antigen/teichoic acid export membrane protein
MDLLAVLIVCIIFSVVMYCINTFFAVDPRIKQLINVILLILFLLWIFGYSGIFYGHRALMER